MQQDPDPEDRNYTERAGHQVTHHHTHLSPPVRRRSPVRPVPAKLSSPLLAELPRAQVVVGPGNPRVTDPRRVHRHRGLQHCLDHRPLCHRIADGAEREPERVGHEEGT